MATPSASSPRARSSRVSAFEQAALRSAQGFHADHDAGQFAYVLVLYPGVPARDIKELIALAKASPARSTSARPARKPRASRERTVCHALGDRAHACALQEHGAIGDRPDRRPIEMQFATIRCRGLATSALANCARSRSPAASASDALPDVPTNG